MPQPIQLLATGVKFSGFKQDLKLGEAYSKQPAMSDTSTPGRRGPLAGVPVAPLNMWASKCPRPEDS